MTIKSSNLELTLYINDLIKLEEGETFNKSDLKVWIEMLKMGSLKCPCGRFEMCISGDCPFYDYRNCSDCNVCEDCESEEDCEYDHIPENCQRYCDGCYGYSDCGDCPRSEVWDEIQRGYIGFKMGEKLANWFIGQIVAKELEKLL